jgi:hypothetical protein
MEAMERVKQSANLITSHVCDNISKAYFELVLADFARQCCWHGPENLAVPYDLQLVFDSAHSPELQPAGHLSAFVDEPLVNRDFDTIEDLDHAVGERCVALTQQQVAIRASTLFHWWPYPKTRIRRRK